MKKMFFSAIFLLFVTTVTNPVSQANATLIGQTITASGESLTPGSATIGSGVEFIGINFLGDIGLYFDFGANTLTITNPNTDQGQLTGWSGYGNYVFSGFTEPITSLSLVSNTGFTANFVNNFSFTTDSITLDMMDGSALAGTPASEVIFSINRVNAPVPEPGTLMLLGLGMFGVAAFSKRRVNKEA
jgi:hypothetical protein